MAQRCSLSALLLACPLFAQHVADFATTVSGAADFGNPMGLSRRGFYGDAATPAPYDFAWTEWAMPIYGGRLRFVNRDGSTWQPPHYKLLVADFGGGMGHAQLPGPLVAGGPVATGSTGFGPYSVPFTMIAELPDASQFENAAAYLGAMPAEYPFGGWKTIGFVTEVTSVGGATHIVGAGIRHNPSNNDRRLDVYRYDTATQSLASLVNGGLTINGPLAGPMRLRLRVQASRVVASYAFGTSPWISVAATTLPGGVTANIQDVRSAAFRIGGIVTANAPGHSVDVGELSMEAANIAAFSGPPAPSGPSLPATQPMLRRHGAYLERNGQLQATGTNRPDLLNWFCGFEATPDHAEHVLDALVGTTDQRLVRFSAIDEVGRYRKDVAGDLPGSPHVGLPLFQLALHRPDLYFEAFDRLIDTATERGLTVVPVLVWDPRAPIALVANGGLGMQFDHVTAAQVRQLYGLAPLVDPDAIAARAVLDTVIPAIVQRYRDHATVAFWEVGNEWDNYVPRSQLTIWSNDWPELWQSPAECGAAIAFVADRIRGATFGADLQHLVSAGHAGAATLWRDNQTCATAATVAQALRDFNPPVVDLVSFHVYPTGQAGGTCGGWAPAPFGSFAAWATEVHTMCLALHSGGDPARPLYFGETNWNVVPYSPAGWASDLADLLGSPAGLRLRPQLAFTWEWMRMPHDLFPGSEVLKYDIQPQHATDPTSQLSVFDAAWAKDAAAPRVLSAGFELTYATGGAPLANVVAEVADVQGDVVTVEVQDANGALITQLTYDAPTQRWRGTVAAPPAGQWASLRIVARDASLASRPWPHLAVGLPTSPAAIPLGPPPPNFGSPTSSDFPFVRSGGHAGYEHIGTDGGQLRVVVQVTAATGQPLPPFTVVALRLNPGGLGPFDDWSTLPLVFGAGPEFVWNIPVTAPLGGFPAMALAFEAAAVHFSSAGFIVSDTWPRLQGH